jgi:hypothetical protein
VLGRPRRAALVQLRRLIRRLRREPRLDALGPQPAL